MNREQYQINKEAKTGDGIVCPVCGKFFVKKQYSQAFCCEKCKDDYWNEIRSEVMPLTPDEILQLSDSLRDESTDLCRMVICQRDIPKEKMDYLIKLRKLINTGEI